MQSVTTAQPAAPCSRSTNAKQRNSSGKTPTSLHGFLLFSVVSLIQGRKTKQRRKPLFSTKGSEGGKKKRKVGYTILIFFLTVDGLSRLNLLGFRHTAPRPPFSLCVPVGRQRGETREQERKERQIRGKKFRETHKIKSNTVILLVWGFFW